MIRKYKNFGYIIPLLLISFYYSVDKFIVQSAVDGGLVLSELVKFPSNFSNVSSIFYNGWTILHQFTFVLFKLNFSVNSVSIILTFIILAFYTLGIYYLTLGISKSHNLALLISLLVVVTRVHFGDVDYPVLFFSEHTYGAFSLAAFTLIIGLLSNENFKMAGVMSAILFAAHLVVGIWIISLIIFSYIITLLFFEDKNKPKYKKIFKGIILLVLPLFLSFIFFRLNVVEKNIYDLNDFQTYLNQWDAHRNVFTINYNYISKTLLLISIMVIYINYFEKNKNQIVYLVILISVAGSMILYLLYKFLPNSFIPLIVIRAMPTRVFLLHSVIGYPIIIAIIFSIFRKANFNFNISKKYFLIIFFFLTFVLIFNTHDFLKKTNEFYANKIEKRFIKFTNILSQENRNDEDIFWEKIHNLKSDGFYVTTFNSSGPTLRHGKKPYLINTSWFDQTAYYPYQVAEVKLIIEDIYGIPFESPPTKFLAVLVDDWFKNTFEKRSTLEWKMLSNKHNISGIIVPSDWNLLIPKTITSKKFTAYIVN
jgi:hypothetical protein